MSVLTGMREMVIDAWSSLSHKAPLSQDAKARLHGWTAKTWVGEEHRRRITAYQILAAYEANVSRTFLDTDDDEDIETRREYGDAGLVIDTVLSALLGEEQEIVVDGADDFDPDLEPPTPSEPDADGQGGGVIDPGEQEAFDANTAAGVLATRQQFLRTWADDVHLGLRLVDSERNAVRYGDGVWLLGWDPLKQRPTAAIMDPGFYFPVLPDTLDAYDYPTKVHFAWEIPAEEFLDDKVRVRRITYELKDLEPVELEETDPDGANLLGLPADTVQKGFDDQGDPVIVRKYPWNTDPTRIACFVTDAMWILDDLQDPENIDAFTLQGAVFREDDDGNDIRDVDLEIDFLPVVHVPNTPPGGDHYGQSSLARVLQILDDLQGADTDAAAAASTTGFPITWSTSGPTPGAAGDVLTGREPNKSPQMEIKPGAHWKLGAEGKAGVIDTSANLKETRENAVGLRDRMLVNARLPGALVGTVKANEYPSGFALQLSFGPLSAMIRQMRLVRSVKYPLLLKMVQRLYQANGVLPEGPAPRAELRLGAFLPSDMDAVLKRVKEAYTAKLISLETAIGMLLDAGFTIDDVAEEVLKIQERDFEGANALADALGDQAETRDYLGREPADQGVPTIVLPPPVVPGGGA